MDEVNPYSATGLCRSNGTGAPEGSDAMRDDRPKYPFPGIVLIVVLVIGVVVGVFWLRSGPSWRLSVATKGAESTVTVTTTASEDPVYSVVIKGWRTRRPIIHVSRTHAATDKAIGVETLFSDETVPPGRWTLKVDGVKFDIMPARLIVNDSFECAPGKTLEMEIDEEGSRR